jgi:DHA1 family quinolone resistance protein-like MFS transporter
MKSEELMGVPRQLFPLYFAFLLDAVAVGLAMPLLPFYVMELGANALQLSMVVSSNYVAQMVGCLVMGQISDKYGRRVVLFMCLIASSVSYFCVSKARTLTGVALARIIAGSCGGLVPIMQSCVADVSSQKERPKYLGRIMATFGMGFVLGPALSALMPGFSTRQKVRMAGCLLQASLLPCCFSKKRRRA